MSESPLQILRGRIPEPLKRFFRPLSDHLFPSQGRLLEIRREKARRMLDALPRPRRLHLGCGENRFEGWVNLDEVETAARPDILWDLKNGIPAADGSCRYLYSEHVLEHFTVEEGVQLLREARRVLEPGGVFRIAMPSLEALLEEARDGTWRTKPGWKTRELKCVRTRAEMLNVAFRGWNHQWLYDREELHRRLKEAGFTVIRDAALGESSSEELRDLEKRPESLLICEAVKEIC